MQTEKRTQTNFIGTTRLNNVKMSYGMYYTKKRESLCCFSFDITFIKLVNISWTDCINILSLQMYVQYAQEVLTEFID